MVWSLCTRVERSVDCVGVIIKIINETFDKSHSYRIQQILNKGGGTMSWIFIIFF